VFFLSTAIPNVLCAPCSFQVDQLNLLRVVSSLRTDVLVATEEARLQPVSTLIIVEAPVEMNPKPTLSGPHLPYPSVGTAQTPVTFGVPALQRIHCDDTGAWSCPRHSVHGKKAHRRDVASEPRPLCHDPADRQCRDMLHQSPTYLAWYQAVVEKFRTRFFLTGLCRIASFCTTTCSTARFCPLTW
jgi:hypothetical protein